MILYNIIIIIFNRKWKYWRTRNNVREYSLYLYLFCASLIIFHFTEPTNMNTKQFPWPPLSLVSFLFVQYIYWKTWNVLNWLYEWTLDVDTILFTLKTVYTCDILGYLVFIFVIWEMMSSFPLYFILCYTILHYNIKPRYGIKVFHDHLILVLKHPQLNSQVMI